MKCEQQDTFLWHEMRHKKKQGSAGLEKLAIHSLLQNNSHNKIIHNIPLQQYQD